MNPTIWTIGHSTRPLNDLVEMLSSHGIQILVDVRSLPGSRKFPHFNKESLAQTIPQSGIEYLHLLDLGGRRKANKGSRNTGWRNLSFRSYADYMETEQFRQEAARMEAMARTARVCYMCSEAVWWRCHRSMISDFLKSRSWDVQHIMGVGTATGHAYTGPAKVAAGTLSYGG